MICYTKTIKLMGSLFKLGVVSDDQECADNLLDIGVSEIKRIEVLFSEFRLDSMTSRINHNAGTQAVVVDKEVLSLVQRSIDISSLSQGAFDITVGPLKKLFEFKNKAFVFPRKEIILSTLKTVGYEKILVNKEKSTILLKEKGMAISFAAIGKGYAADRVKKLWKEMGVLSAYINASGDLTAFGKNEHGEDWNVGIANPDKQSEMLFFVPLENGCVATSGDYEQHFLYDGKRYSHNINPKTGIPIEGMKSVTIVSPSAELSDALATAVYTMGVEQGLHFVDQLPHTFAIVINDKNKVFFSRNTNVRYEEYN